MGKIKDLTGQRFGRLLVISFSHSGNGIHWNCLCDCGVNITVKTSRLNSGGKRSCGCLLVENKKRFMTHGKCKHELFYVWHDMKYRCSNKKSNDYKYYGGRGISVCESWESDFLEFLKDMGERPKGLTLERIDTNGNYEPSNCKWASREDQNQNSRRSKRWDIKGKIFKSASLAGRYFGVDHVTIIRWCQSNKHPNCVSTTIY